MKTIGWWFMDCEHEIYCVSDRPGFHSYFDVCPENPSGDRFVYFAPRLEKRIGETPQGLPLFEGNVVVAGSFGEEAREVGPLTRGNRQAGPRQQWLDDDTVAFVSPGEKTSGTTCVSLSDLHTRTLPGAIRMADPLGRKLALTSSHETRATGFASEDEAVYLQDFSSGEFKRLFGVEEALASHPRRNEIRHPEHLQMKHTKWAPTGDRFFVVFHHENFRRDNLDADIRVKSLMVADADGSNLHYASEFGAHPLWGADNRTIYAFGTDANGAKAMTLHPADGGEPEEAFPGIHANHASLSPDGRFLAMDYFGVPEAGMASVWCADLESEREIRLAAFEAPDTSGATGTHPHPVWSRYGKYIYFNAAEDNTPYVYKVAAPTEYSS